jgi:hypothetical protein
MQCQPNQKASRWDHNHYISLHYYRLGQDCYETWSLKRWFWFKSDKSMQLYSLALGFHTKRIKKHRNSAYYSSLDAGFGCARPTFKSVTNTATMAVPVQPYGKMVSFHPPTSTIPVSSGHAVHDPRHQLARWGLKQGDTTGGPIRDLQSVLTHARYHQLLSSKFT